MTRRTQKSTIFTITVYYKGYEWMAVHEKVCRARSQSVPSPETSVLMESVHCSPSTSVCSPTRKLPQASSLWVFIKVPLCRHPWLNHWPLVIKLSLQPLSPPRRSDMGLKVLATSSVLKLSRCPESLPVSINSDIMKSGSLWITKDIPIT